MREEDAALINAWGRRCTNQCVRKTLH